MGKPKKLYRLAEAVGLLTADLAADTGNLKKLGLILSVCALSKHFRLRGIAQYQAFESAVCDHNGR